MFCHFPIPVERYRLTSVNQNNFLALPAAVAVVGFYRRHMQIALGSIGHGASQASEGVDGEGDCHFHNWPKNQQQTAQLLADTQAD